jgi:hypothetical protein
VGRGKTSVDTSLLLSHQVFLRFYASLLMSEGLLSLHVEALRSLPSYKTSFVEHYPPTQTHNKRKNRVFFFQQQLSLPRSLFRPSTFFFFFH